MSPWNAATSRCNRRLSGLRAILLICLPIAQFGSGTRDQDKRVIGRVFAEGPCHEPARPRTSRQAVVVAAAGATPRQLEDRGLGNDFSRRHQPWRCADIAAYQSSAGHAGDRTASNSGVLQHTASRKLGTAQIRRPQPTAACRRKSCTAAPAVSPCPPRADIRPSSYPDRRAAGS